MNMENTNPCFEPRQRQTTTPNVEMNGLERQVKRSVVSTLPLVRLPDLGYKSVTTRKSSIWKRSPAWNAMTIEESRIGAPGARCRRPPSAIQTGIWSARIGAENPTGG